MFIPPGGSTSNQPGLTCISSLGPAIATALASVGVGPEGTVQQTPPTGASTFLVPRVAVKAKANSVIRKRLTITLGFILPSPLSIIG